MSHNLGEDAVWIGGLRVHSIVESGVREGGTVYLRPDTDMEGDLMWKVPDERLSRFRIGTRILMCIEPEEGIYP